MASSTGAVITTLAGRDFCDFAGVGIREKYRIVLRPLPRGMISLNSVFLRGYATGRSYKVDDLENELQILQVMDNIKALRRMK